MKDVIADRFAEADMPRVAAKLRDCSVTEVLCGCSHCGHAWYVRYRCRSRVCPVCSYRVARQRAHFVRCLTNHMAYPKLLTLTQPLWTSDPRAGIRYLRQCFNKLRRRPLFANVKGGAYTIELKPSGKHWHIHLHAVIDCPFLPYQRLFSVWRDILGCQAPQVDIRAATTASAKDYVAKYATKSLGYDATTSKVVEWYVATLGLRLFTTFGAWYNAKIDALENEHDSGPFVPVCPHCGSERTFFRVRDGPRVFGLDAWIAVRDIYLAGRDYSRPCPEFVRTRKGIDFDLTAEN